MANVFVADTDRGDGHDVEPQPGRYQCWKCHGGLRYPSEAFKLWQVKGRVYGVHESCWEMLKRRGQ